MSRIPCNSAVVVKPGGNLPCLQEILIGSGTMDYPVNHCLSDILVHI